MSLIDPSRDLTVGDVTLTDLPLARRLALFKPLTTNISIVTVATLAAKLLGFIEKQVIAYCFGVGPLAEAYFLVSSLTGTLGTTARELTEPVLVPRFVNLRGVPAHRTHVFRLYAAGLLLLAVSAAASAALFAPGVIRVAAPGLSAQSAEVSTRLLPIAVWGATFLAVCAVTQAALHAQQRFAVAATSDLIYRSCLIAGCVAAVVTTLGATAVGFGIALGAFVKCFMQWVALRSATAPIPAASGPSAPGAALWPLVVGVVLSQFAELSETHFASLAEPGAVAARMYAKKLVDLPILLGPCALSAVAFPYLSQLASSERRDELERLVAISLHWIIVCFVPLAVVMLAISQPLVSLLLQRGRFDHTASTLTSAVVSTYSLGLLTFALDAVVVPVFYAVRDTRTPTLAGALGVLLNLGMLPLLTARWGVCGVAASLVLAKSAKIALLSSLLFRRHVRLTAATKRTAIAMFGSAVPALALARELRARWQPEYGFIRLTAAVLAMIVIFGVGYASLLRLAARRDQPTRRLV